MRVRTAERRRRKTLPKLLRARTPQMSRNSRRSANWPEADMLPATGSQELASSFSVGDSLSIAKIAEKLGCYPQTVRRRLHRFNTEGIDGLGEVKQTTTTRG